MMKEGEKWPTPAKTGKNAVRQDERDEDGRSDDRTSGAGRRIMTNHSRSEEKREKRKQRRERSERRAMSEAGSSEERNITRLPMMAGVAW